MFGTSKSIWGFDPRSIPNCIVWLDGIDSNTMTPSTPTNGTQITAWRDKSVNGVSYASGAVPTYAGCNVTPPTYVTGGGINFNPSIPGGGTFTNNVTQGLSAVGGFPLNATGFTAFAVAASTGTMTTFNSYFSYFTGGAEFIDFDAGGGTFGQIITDTTGLNVTIPSTVLTTTRQIQSVRSSTTGTNFFVNGSLSNSSSFSYTQVNNPVATVVWIGNQAPGFRSFSGTIFELLVYNQSLSSNQRQTVEGYLARKWAITLATTHPFSVLPPFNRYFNPTDVPGCSLWLDAADNSSMNSTTTVTSWLDKSGSNNTMMGTATWTGTTMSFNGSTQAFSNTAYVFPASNYSMFAVYSNTTAPSAGAYMNVVYGSNGFPMLGTFDSSRFVSARSVVANTGALVANVAASSNVLVSATYEPSTFSPFVNGITATTLAGTTLATTGVFVGGPSNYFNGTISELLIYSSTLTAAQRQQVEGYLIDKWSLRAQTLSNHQYRLIPPASVLPFQPTGISTPLIWFDAADRSTITFSSGSVISTWSNKGSSAAHATTRTGSLTSGVTTFNGLNIVNCPASANLGFTMAIPNQPRAWFAVFRLTSQLTTTGLTQYFAIVNQTAGNGQDSIAGPMAPTNIATNTYSIGEGPSGIAANINTVTAPNGFNVMSQYGLINSAASTTSNFIMVNGTAMTLNASLVASGYNTTSLLYEIGDRYGGSGADIAEIMMFNTELSTPQRQQVEGYIGWKWGIARTLPATHPFYKYPPALA